MVRAITLSLNTTPPLGQDADGRYCEFAGHVNWKVRYSHGMFNPSPTVPVAILESVVEQTFSEQHRRRIQSNWDVVLYEHL